MGFLLLLLPLLSVCLLSCSGTAGATVRVNVGSDAVLPCFIRPERNIRQDVFDWKKDGQKEVFFYEKGQYDGNGRDSQDEQFKGRVFHFPEQLQSGNASIIIENTIMNDSGNYTCDISPAGPNRQTYNIELVVDCTLRDRSEENVPGACQKPHITSLEGTDHWPILKCEVQGVPPESEIELKDSAGNKLAASETRVSKRGGNNDIILKTTVTKTDNYRCIVTQEEICHQVSDSNFVYVPDSSAGLAADVVVTFVVTLVGLLAKGCITQN